MTRPDTGTASEGLPTRLVAFAVVLCAAGIAAFVILRLLAPLHGMGWDEAYYLGIGRNLLAGRGLQTLFGEFPSVHSPLWPLVLQGPASLFGIDPGSWGHPLVVLCGALAVGLTGWYAWRSIRLAAPLAVASLIAFPFLLDLAGWMGLDLPAAALTMLYVGSGIAAVRRGSFALGLVAGLLFASAFLIKELALPFAPVPIVAGLLRATPLARIGRGFAGIVLAGVVGVSWWFAIYAQETGSVYRLGTPVWTLAPLLLGVLALVVIGLALGRTEPSGVAVDDAGRRWMVRVGWLGALAWAGLLTVYFAVAPNPIGAGFLVPAQLKASLVRFGPSLWPILSVGATGAAIAVIERLRPSLLAAPPDDAPPWARDLLHPDDRHAVDDLIVATLCGFPFVLLVASVGEGPRHYIANLGFIVALAAIGWTKLLVAVARRPSPSLVAMLGLALVAAVFIGSRSGKPAPLLLAVEVAVPLFVVGLAIAVRAGRTRHLSTRTGRSAIGLVVGGLLAVVVGSSTLVMASALPKAPDPTDETDASVVATTAAWVREHLPPGSTVVFGSGFAMQTALQLVDDYRLALVADETGIDADPAAPLGLTAVDGSRADDWVALWASRRDATSFAGYRAGPVLDAFRRLGPSTWVQTAVVDESGYSPLLAALDRAEGLEELARWSWPYGAGRLETVVYRVDPSRLAFSDAVVLTSGALSRLVGVMSRDPEAFRDAAATLLARAVVVPPGGASGELLDRLRAIAAR